MDSKKPLATKDMERAVNALQKELAAVRERLAEALILRDEAQDTYYAARDAAGETEARRAAGVPFLNDQERKARARIDALEVEWARRSDRVTHLKHLEEKIDSGLFWVVQTQSYLHGHEEAFVRSRQEWRDREGGALPPAESAA